ncbi:hypothetical protein OG607_06390 [Streptomyces sp. NBC_01537]|uniref:hypothetical protein n=1 Tax=Streptomyces sp. NBC_01537 TaxID=2903896 RepID=UPI00386C1E22
MLVEPYAEGAWLLYWVDPRREPADRVMGEHTGDSLIPSPGDLDKVLGEQFAVEWAHPSEAEAIRQRFFDLEEPPKRSVLDTLKAAFRARITGAPRGATWTR